MNTQPTQPEALRLADELDAYHTRPCHKQAAAELRRLHDENAQLREQNTALDAACAKLEAVRGTPTAGEPAGWLYDWVSDEGELVRDWFTTDYDEAHSEANQAHNIRALDHRGTSPQPVWEPLSRKRVKELVREAGYDTAPVQHRADFINGIRHGEAAHGIKGGQHGTDT